jgi:hypothetical protein
MGIYHGGMAVTRGVYWNPIDGQNVSIRKRDILPGDENRKYLKVSSAWLLLASPLIAMVFILFLPLFGIGVLLSLAAIPLIKLSFEVIASAVRVCSGFHTRRVVHKWSFSGKLRKQNKRLTDNLNQKRDGSGNKN